MRPFDFFVDLLHPQLDFLPRALAVAVLAAVVCAIVGTHVVLRGSAFVGEAVAHAVFPGIAVAVLLGGSVLLGGAVAGAITAVLFTLAAQSRRVSQDSAIGIAFVAAFAVGLVLLSRARGYTGSLEGFLFGSVMSVAPEEVPVLMGLGAVLVVAAVWLTPTFLTVALDRESARAQGLPVVALDLALNLLVTAAIVLSVHVVGNILVVALLVAAPAAARLCTDRWNTMLVLGPVFGALASLLGLWAAWTWDVPAGAAIVLAAAGIFVVTLVVGPRHGLVPVHVLPRLRGRRRRGADDDGGGVLAAAARRAPAGVAAALAAVLVGAGLAVSPGADAAEIPQRRALHNIHVDATHLHWDAERGLRLDVIEGQDTRVPADDVIVDLQPEMYEGVDVSKLTVPEPREGRDLSFLGAPGTQLWNAPQALYGDWKPVWVGLGAGAIPASRVDITSLRIHLVDVQGPGDVEVFSMTPAGVSRAFSSKDPKHQEFAVEPYAHGHFNWAFTKPGTYTMTFEGTGTDPRTGKGITSNRSRVIFRVGGTSAKTDTVPVGPESPRHPGDASVDPAPADPAPTPAPTPSTPGPVPTTSAPGPGAPTTPAPADPAPSSPAPTRPTTPGETQPVPRPGGSESERQCPPLLTVGHVDMAVHGGADGLRAVLKDETRGAPVDRRPEDVVLGLTDALRVRVPAGFESVGAAGSTVWMVPQVQNPGGLWSGFNTQEVDYGGLDGPVSVELASFSGPGRAVLFEEDLLRGVRVLWDTASGGPRSFPMAIPSHVHHALSFTAPGRYELNLRYTARTKDGRTVSAPARYTVLVGGAALAGHGCGGSAAPAPGSDATAPGTTGPVGQAPAGPVGPGAPSGPTGPAAGPWAPGSTPGAVPGMTSGPAAGPGSGTGEGALAAAPLWAGPAAVGATGASPWADAPGVDGAQPAGMTADDGAAWADGSGPAPADGTGWSDGSAPAGGFAEATPGVDAGPAGDPALAAAGAPGQAGVADPALAGGPGAGQAGPYPGVVAAEGTATVNPVLAGLRQHPEVVPVTGAGLVLLIGLLLWLSVRQPVGSSSTRPSSSEGTPTHD